MIEEVEAAHAEVTPTLVQPPIDVAVEYPSVPLEDEDALYANSCDFLSNLEEDDVS